MKPFPIPVVVLGPGSQPEEDPLQYIASPGEMAVFSKPRVRPAQSGAATEAAKALLSQFVSAMEQSGLDGHRRRACVSLSDLPPDATAAVNELLGSGEVSVLITAPAAFHIQETAFAGVWRVQAIGEAGRVTSDLVEAAPIPTAVHEAVAFMRPYQANTSLPPPQGVMNAPSILRELITASAEYQQGDAAHIVNLTLLPVTPEDIDYLASRLGGGPVTILSRGYGNCRITSTALPHTWWVQYFNSTDQLILNTLEVIDVPQAALAADEDFQDSIERLRDWLSTLSGTA